MKLTKRLSVMVVLAVVFFSFVVVQPVQAAREGTVALSNIIGTGVTTLVSGLLHGRVKTLGEGLSMFLYGGAAGFGFYQSKKMVASGKIPMGMLLANVSASVSENASLKENPLAYLNFTWAFARVRLATPLARNARSTIGIDISAREVINLAMSAGKASRITLRGGMLGFESRAGYRNAQGWTRGMFATTLEGSGDVVYRHEMVHVVQNMQLSAQNFYEPFLNRDSHEGGRSLISFQGLRLDTLGTANDLMMGLQSYEGQWKEIEAYHFSGR